MTALLSAGWWESLTLTSQIYFCVAIAGTAALLIQSILMFFGIGDSAEAGDFDGSFDGEGLNLFSIRGIVAFLTIGGWVGFLLASFGIQDWITIVVSIAAGLIALFGIALIMKAFMKLQSNGSMDMNNAVGKTATVYLRIPPKGEGSGKVTLTFGGRFVEADAISEDDRSFAVQTLVKVTGVLGDELIVAAADEADNAQTKPVEK